MPTSNISIEYLEEGQRQKEATINSGFDTIDGEMYKDMGEYTVAGIPAAADHPNAYAVITDGPNGRTIVRSDGSNWMQVALEGSQIA